MRLLWVAALGGCAREASVDIAMTGAGPPTVRPRYAELRHEEGGWIRVDLASRPAQAAGAPVVLATADLPKGRYEALRLVYVASPGDPETRENDTRGVRAGKASAPVREREEATFWKPFCIRSDGDQVLLRLVPHNPASSGTLQVDVRAPQC